jgi:hypothetical protein
VTRLGRPFRAFEFVVTLSQGVALGWHESPLRGWAAWASASFSSMKYLPGGSRMGLALGERKSSWCFAAGFDPGRGWRRRV